MEGGEKMRRFLKKLSLLCLTLVLCASVFLGLSTNAASEDIDDFYLTEEEAAALGGICFEGLNPREVREKVDWCQKNFVYYKLEPFFAQWLEEIGEENLAKSYAGHRNPSKILSSLDFLPPKKLKIEFNYRTYLETINFFLDKKFKPDPSNPAAVGICALIFGMSFDRAMEWNYGR